MRKQDDEDHPQSQQCDVHGAHGPTPGVRTQRLRRRVRCRAVTPDRESLPPEAQRRQQTRSGATPGPAPLACHLPSRSRTAVCRDRGPQRSEDTPSGAGASRAGFDQTRACSAIPDHAGLGGAPTRSKLPTLTSSMPSTVGLCGGPALTLAISYTASAVDRDCAS
jgi:hypothetical protein